MAGGEGFGRRAFGEFARRTAVGGAVGDIGGPWSAGAEDSAAAVPGGSPLAVAAVRRGVWASGQGWCEYDGSGNKMLNGPGSRMPIDHWAGSARAWASGNSEFSDTLR